MSNIGRNVWYDLIGESEMFYCIFCNQLDLLIIVSKDDYCIIKIVELNSANANLGKDIEGLWYSDIKILENIIVLIPDKGSAFAVYNLNENRLKKVELPVVQELNGYEYNGVLNFSGAIIGDDNMIYCIPRRYPALVELDLLSGTLFIHNDWVEYELQSAFNNLRFAELGFVMCDNKIYMAMSHSNIILEFDIITKKSTVLYKDNQITEYASMVLLDSFIYILDRKNRQIMVYEINLGKMYQRISIEEKVDISRSCLFEIHGNIILVCKNVGKFWRLRDNVFEEIYFKFRNIKSNINLLKNIVVWKYEDRLFFYQYKKCEIYEVLLERKILCCRGKLSYIEDCAQIVLEKIMKKKKIVQESETFNLNLFLKLLL